MRGFGKIFRRFLLIADLFVCYLNIVTKGSEGVIFRLRKTKVHGTRAKKGAEGTETRYYGRQDQFYYDHGTGIYTGCDIICDVKIKA